MEGTTHGYVRLYRSLDGVNNAVIQDDIFYKDVRSLIRPDYVPHGDNWRTGPESAIRASSSGCARW